MSDLDVLRAFAGSREADAIIIRDGITYGNARGVVAQLSELREQRDDADHQCFVAKKRLAEVERDRDAAIMAFKLTTSLDSLSDVELYELTTNLREVIDRAAGVPK